MFYKETLGTNLHSYISPKFVQINNSLNLRSNAWLSYSVPSAHAVPTEAGEKQNFTVQLLHLPLGLTHTGSVFLFGFCTYLVMYSYVFIQITMH